MGEKGHGITVGKGASTPTLIGKLDAISIDGQERTVLNDSDFDSTNEWETFFQGMLNAGTLTLEMLYDESNANTVQGMLSAAADTYVVTFAGGSTYSCSAFWQSLGWPSAPRNGEVRQSGTLKLSGEPTFTVA